MQGAAAAATVGARVALVLLVPAVAAEIAGAQKEAKRHGGLQETTSTLLPWDGHAADAENLAFFKMRTGSNRPDNL